MTVNTETLTPNQAARRGRVLDAAMALAAEGGYDAVQMRDVAAEPQVALGTIYRYFSSKDHLLAACQVELWQAQADRLAERPPDGETPAERVAAASSSRAMRGAAREPKRTAALITASSSPDPAVRDCQAADHGDHGSGARETPWRDVEADRRAPHRGDAAPGLVRVAARLGQRLERRRHRRPRARATIGLRMGCLDTA